MDFREDVCLGMKSPLLPPLMNGGGCCKTISDVEIMATSSAGAIVGGSYTWDESPGNSGKVFKVIEDDGLNALGLPNPGRKGVARDVPEMAMIAHDAGKKFIVSISCSTPDEYGDLAAIALEKGADGVEANLACPNKVTAEGKRAPLACYDITSTGKIISKIEQCVGVDAVVWFKVAAYLNRSQLEDAGAMITSFRVPKAVVTMNTVFGCLDFDEYGEPVISVGLAGLSGRAVKRIRLGQVYMLHQALEEKLPVIAVGGIDSALDIHKSALAGAVAFQMTTEVIKGNRINPNVFFRVIDEYDRFKPKVRG